MMKYIFGYSLLNIIIGLLLSLITACNQEYSRIEKIEEVKQQIPETPGDRASSYVTDDDYAVAPIQRQGKLSTAKNVIIMIGDGMGPAQVAGGMIANRGKLFMQQTEYTGLSITQNAYGKITDSAAGATAMATGVKTYNKAIAMDTLGKPLTTLFMEAKRKGMATGLAVGCEITDATPASFVVNHPDRNELEAIAAKLVEAPLDFLYGGGRKYFDQRSDQQNLLQVWEEKGYQLVSDTSELQKIKRGKVIALMSENGPTRVSERKAAYIQKGVHKALELLSRNDVGFMLMIEGSQIDDAGHFNEVAYHVEEVLDFDKVVGEVLKFAAEDGETLVVITADHETGGFTLVDGDMKEGTLTAKFSSTDHTAVMVPVFSFGPGSNLFSGFYQNTEIYEHIRQALSWTEAHHDI